MDSSISLESPAKVMGDLMCESACICVCVQGMFSLRRAQYSSNYIPTLCASDYRFGIIT